MILERQRIIDAAQTILKVAEGISTEESRKADNYDRMKEYMRDMISRMLNEDSEEIKKFVAHACMPMNESRSIEELELGELVRGYVELRVKRESEEVIQDFKNAYLGTLR